MPRRSQIPLLRERVILAQLQLDLIRSLSASYLAKGGAVADMATHMVSLGCLIAMSEGKPATAYKLASSLGLPRATVARKLKALADAGVLVMEGHNAIWNLDLVRTPENIAGTLRRIEIVKNAAAKLSKMDANVLVSGTRER